MVTDVLDIGGDHLEVYRNIKSLCCVTGSNIALWVSYTLKRNKYREGVDVWLSDAEGGDVALDVKVKRYKLSVIRQTGAICKIDRQWEFGV